MPTARTVLDFHSGCSDAIPLIERWARRWHYKLDRIEADGTRHYSLGFSFLNVNGRIYQGLPGDGTHLFIRATNGSIHIEAWRAYGIARKVVTFGILSGTRGIESGGVIDWGGRREGRAQINGLIATLGGPAVP